jgi:uncharacterized repeat protein (TIGR03803 family)
LTFGLAVDGTHVYWSTNQAGTGTINRVPLAGGTATTLVTGQNQAGGLAVTSTNVYWASESGVMVAPLTGGAASQLYGFGFSVPFGVAIGP